MDIRKIFGVDVKKVSEGVWASIGGGVEVKVRRADDSNREYAVARAKKFSEKEAQWKKALDMFSQDEITAVVAELYAEHIVLDWRGIEMNGESIPFSKEKFIELATMPGMDDFLDSIVRVANNRILFAWEDEADLIKKQESSTGTD